MTPQLRAMALAMLTVLLPRSFHQKSARVVWTVSGNAHVNSAWSVFCAALALHSLRVWSIEWWQIGFRGMIALALRHLIAVACGLPCLRNIVQREVRKELASVESKMHGQGDSQALVKLPQEAWSCSRIWQQIQRFQAAEASVYAARPESQTQTNAFMQQCVSCSGLSIAAYCSNSGV